MLKVRQRLGKYRLDRRLAQGGFATVYRALDTVTGVPVALKVPNPGLMTKDALDDFRREVRLTAGLDHPNILPIKDAGMIDSTFVVVYPLGRESLADRMSRRMAVRTMVQFADQMLAAVAFAHGQRIMHCDLKPDNFILFSDNVLRLADFGIAKVARRTIAASGSGTVGYIAPEQALGKPSFRSDVFSLGLILYRMFSGCLPEWPFAWPPPGFDRIRRSVDPAVIAFLRRAMEVDHRKRFADGAAMKTAFKRVRARALRSKPARKRRKTSSNRTDWRTMRRRDFLKRYRTVLEISGTCHRCQSPVAATMRHCPWCGVKRRIDKTEHRFPRHCPRCKRGLKADWRFCPWCYGAAVNAEATPRYSDVRYAARCSKTGCPGRDLMPWMQYCPWCRTKVRRPWKIPGSNRSCACCGWGVLPDYWDYCPWCGRAGK